MPCGRVRLERRSIIFARCLSTSVMPSAPPITKQTCSLCNCQSFRCAANSSEVGALPRSSSTTRYAPSGTASKIRFSSAAMPCAAFTPAPRFSGLISFKTY